MTFSIAQRAKASLLHSLHERVLVLPNAWDALSARLAEDAGATAVATTSAGVAWSLGVADGGRLGRTRAIDVVRRVVAAVEVPVTADIEDGYADDPAGVAETVEGVLAAGAVGVNIEDAGREVEEQAGRVAAARRAADALEVPLFVNARVDTYLFGGGDLADTLARAAAYLDAGADGVFVPGVTDPALIAVLVEKIPAPLNVLTGPGGPTVAELAALGVARVSTGSAVAEAAYSVAHRAAREAYAAGTWTALAGADLDYGAVNRLLAP
jgi:2-methylisocitrate lyase-like PEP mutase family enzyme